MSYLDWKKSKTKRCDGKSYSYVEQFIPHQIFYNHFKMCNSGIFPALFVHVKVKEYMPRQGKSSKVKWLLMWANIAYFGLSANNDIFKDNIEVTTDWCSWALALNVGKTNGFLFSNVFHEKKTVLESQSCTFPKFGQFFMGNTIMKQFAAQTIGCSIGTMAFTYVSAFLGLSGTMLYKATWNLHTKELFKRPVLLLVGWLVCGSNLISKAYGMK